MDKKIVYLLFVAFCCYGFVSCNSSEISTIPTLENDSNQKVEDPLVEGVDYFLPNIDLRNWKVTLPVGGPTEVKPPEILEYGTNDLLTDFMYNDSLDGSLVFYTYPGSTTSNATYSRTELRELIDGSSSNVNWTFPDGGIIKGTLALEDISKDAGGEYHRTIIMQIHGRLTDDQKDLIGASDNNAPPVLKIYWNNNRIRVIRKILKDVNVDEIDVLRNESWGGEGFWFDQEVGFDPFTLEVQVSDGKMVIILNDAQTMTFDDIHMQRWNVFENYFKAGNYLSTIDDGAYAKVKYYDLEVTH